jgi:hypothetical protein
MTPFTIKTETTEEFFKRGRQWAKAADQGKRLPQVRGISFEDPVEMMQFMTATRLALFRAEPVKESGASEQAAKTRPI